MPAQATRPRNITDVLDELEGVKGAGQGKWTATCPCPGHDTPAKHLHVEDAGDKALVTCFPGTHGYAAICAALGFQTLSYGSNGHKPPVAPVSQAKAQPRGRIVATCDYVGDDSQLLFQTVRYEPKDFRQRRPDGSGGWVWNLDGVPHVLYHLPDVRLAVTYGETILICAGEKDADNGLLLGYVATTAPLGEGPEKWLPEHTETLRSATVVIVPDLDDTGRKYGEAVAWALWGVATSVRVLMLPTTCDCQLVKDLSDWMAAGGDRDAFDALLAECREYQPPEKAPSGGITLRRMQDVKAEKVEWLWHPYVPKSKVTLVEGDPGEGKSQLVLAVGSGVSCGHLYGVGHVEPGNVLLASAEDGLADTIKPRLTALGADTSRVYAMDGLLTLDDAGMGLLKQSILKLRPVLTIIDPIVAYLGGEVDINKANQIRHVMAQLARMAEQHWTAIVVIRHLTKGTSLKPIYRGLGSIDFTAAARSVLLAGQDPETGARALVHIKCNVAALGPAVGYELGPDGFAWTGESDVTAGRILAADDGGTQMRDAEDLLRELLTEPTLATECYNEASNRGISNRTLNRAKKHLSVVVAKEKKRTGNGSGRCPMSIEKVAKHATLKLKIATVQYMAIFSLYARIWGRGWQSSKRRLPILCSGNLHPEGTQGT